MLSGAALSSTPNVSPKQTSDDVHAETRVPKKLHTGPMGAKSSCEALQDICDLQLLQHFTLDVSRTLADESKDITLWQRMVPPIAFEYPFVLHGLLAVSVYARQKLSSKAIYIARAQLHHARTLPAFVQELGDPNEGNINALYLRAVLLSFHYFAQGLRFGEYLVFGDLRQPEWLWLLGGVRTMVQRRGRQPLEELDGIHAEHSAFPADQLLRHVYVTPLNYHIPLKQLRQLVQDSPDSFRAAVDNLEMCFVHAFVDDSNAPGVRPLNHLIIAWLYLLDPDFLRAAQNQTASASCDHCALRYTSSPIEPLLADV
ncbi:hypothetical protein MBLNU13_g09739t1 [Cladosporium sp. NU13]